MFDRAQRPPTQRERGSDAEPAPQFVRRPNGENRRTTRRPLAELTPFAPDDLDAHTLESEANEAAGNVARGEAVGQVRTASAGELGETEPIHSGGGSPLPAGTRAQMESAFGRDFGHVRVHDDLRASELNHTYEAKALTTGSHIFFREGEYRPEPSIGRALLAHELTHTIQQGATSSERGASEHVQRQPDGAPPPAATGTPGYGATATGAAPTGAPATETPATGTPATGTPAAEPMEAAPAGEAPARREPVGPGRPPVKTASGLDAVKALQVLPFQKPITVSGGAFGDVTLVPGAIANEKLLLVATPLSVYYIDGKDLWVAYTPDFVRDIWLTAFGQGVQRAEWLLPIIEAEFAFLMAFIAPWYLVAGLTVLQGTAFYASNRVEFHQAVRDFSEFNEQRIEFKRRYPTLYGKVLNSALIATLFDLPKGVSLEDVAYLVGRILGHQGLLGQAMKGVTITAKVVAKVVLQYVILVGTLHSPGIVARAAKAAARDTADKLQNGFNELGFKVSKAEADRMVVELALYEDSAEFLKAFGQSAAKLGASLEALTKKGGH
jgi:hypothetical protein